ncbi:MAG: hypothetical protein PHI12_08605 [Dehalococcoidales bacterium]|nr:hypothetical protein [Dehalococcoidales bacterium]
MDEQRLFIDIGRLQEGQAAVRAAVEDLTTSANSLAEKVNSLPCAVHSGDIETLLNWKAQCNGNKETVKIEKLKGTISLKNGLILIVITAVVTGLITKIIEALVK